MKSAKKIRALLLAAMLSAGVVGLGSCDWLDSASVGSGSSDQTSESVSVGDSEELSGSVDSNLPEASEEPVTSESASEPVASEEPETSESASEPEPEPDETAPVITIQGETSYKEGDALALGISATDETDGEVTCNVVYPDGMKDAEGKLNVGTWAINVTATDAAGNKAEQTVTVTVVAPDKTAPVITISGKTEYAQGDSLALSISATDETDGEVTCNAVYPDGMQDAEGKLNVGTWTINVTATDAAGNKAEESVTITVKKTYKNYGATIEELKAGFTYDWEDRYMSVSQGERKAVADIENATAKAAIEGASEGFSSGAVMHLTGSDRHDLNGLTRDLGNLKLGYVYSFEIWYYGVSTSGDYAIALGDGNQNTTLFGDPFKNGLNKLSFDYEPNSDVQCCLTFWTNGAAMDVYLGEMTIKCKKAEVNRTDFHAVTDEEMQADGGYTYDWGKNNVLKVASNSKYMQISAMEDADLQAKLQATGAFKNDYAMRFTGTGGAYVECLSGKLVEGATYTITFDAYEVTRGSTCVLLMNAGNAQAGREDYNVTNNSDGTARFTTTFKAASSYQHVSLYIINTTEIYLANFNIKMEAPETNDQLTEVQLPGSKTASDCNTYSQGALTATPDAVKGQEGFGEQAYKLATVQKTDGSYDKTFELFSFKDVTQDDQYFKSIAVTIYYYVEEITGAGLYLQMDSANFQALDGTAGYHKATFTFAYGINYFSIHYQDGHFGTIYLGGIDYVVTTMRDVSDTSLVERDDYAAFSFTDTVSDNGYTFDFSDDNALQLSANAEYRQISGMPEGALKQALLDSGAYTSGYALRLKGMGSSYVRPLNYNLVPGYTYTISFDAYQVTNGGLCILPMGGQQVGQHNFTATKNNETGLYIYSVTFTAKIDYLRVNLYLLGECDLYLANFTVKATAPTEAHAVINAAEGSFLADNGTAQLATVGYAGSNAIAVTPSSATAGVWVTTADLTNYNVGDKVHVSFRINPVSKTAYANVNVYDGNGTLIDYAYPANGWSFVNYDATVVEKEGVKYVYIGLNKATNELCYISEVAVDGETTAMGNLFGGTKLIQIANAGVPQMQGYVFKTTDNKLAVFDGGTTSEAASLYEVIKANAQRNDAGKYVVDAWFISHYHSDHVGALIQLLNVYDDVFITALYYDFDGAAASQDADYSYVTDLKTALTTHAGKLGNIVTPKQKDEVTVGAIKVKVLNNAYFNSSTNIVNNSSIVFKVETAGEDVLLFADLGNYGDTLMQDEYFASEMKTCRVVQMAHHGQNGVSDAVYQAIEDIRVCLYPAPAWLYNVYNTTSDTGMIGSGTYGTLGTRELMRALGVRYSYSMVDGIVTVY